MRAPLLAVALLVILAACTPPGARSGGVPPQLYVLNGRGGTVTRLDAASGRIVGAPLATPASPLQAVPGPAGSLLVLARASATAGGGLARRRPSGAAWASEPVVVEAGARVTLLAGDGRRYAAVAYEGARPAAPPAGRGCHLALIDLQTAAVTRSRVGCTGGEVVTALAVGGAGPDGAGPLVYAGLWRGAGQPGPGGRVVALAGESGVARASVPTAGAPRDLVLGPAPDPLGRVLYCVEVIPGAENADLARTDPARAAGDRWRLTVLDPPTLIPVGEHELADAPLWLTVAPDGREAFALARGGSPALSSTVLRVDLTTGAVAALATLPGAGQGLAHAGDRLYVPAPERDAVWVVDRRRGALLQPVAVGRGPIGIVARAGRGRRRARRWWIPVPGGPGATGRPAPRPRPAPG